MQLVERERKRELSLCSSAGWAGFPLLHFVHCVLSDQPCLSPPHHLFYGAAARSPPYWAQCSPSALSSVGKLGDFMGNDIDACGGLTDTLSMAVFTVPGPHCADRCLFSPPPPFLTLCLHRNAICGDITEDLPWQQSADNRLAQPC